MNDNGELAAQDPFPNFGGTDVPRKSLFDHLKQGGTLDTFIGQFPAVTRDKAETILAMAEMKQNELTKAGNPASSLFGAYLEAVNEPENEVFWLDAMELVKVAHDEDALRRVAKEKGFLINDEFLDHIAKELEVYPDDNKAKLVVPPETTEWLSPMETNFGIMSPGRNKSRGNSVACEK